MALLEIRGLTLAAEDGSTTLLRGIDLEVRDGETVALVGESGSGKSLTSRLVLGLRPPGYRVSGEVTVGGLDALAPDGRTVMEIRRSVASMVYQDPRSSFNPLSTIGNYLEEAQRACGASRTDARARAIRLLERVAIPDPEGAMSRYPHEFSGGMLQRVVIAGALSTEPRLLLADEATTALDVTIQAEVIGLLQSVGRESGLGMLFVTHNLDLAATIADRVYVMRQGSIIEEGPVRAVFDDPADLYTRELLAAVPRMVRRDDD